MTDPPVTLQRTTSRRTRKTGQTSGTNDRSTIARAWESFTSGEASVRGVRPQILASWYRCRDTYDVDPNLEAAPGASDHTDHRLDHDVLLAELGGIAATAGQRLEGEHGIVAVADGRGRVLASWGDPAVRAHAEKSNLAPWSAWAENTTGTNGMGTALESRGPITVTGPEHWCEGFHHWSCAAIAIRDVVTDSPVAMINVSRWSAGIPAQVTSWLARSVAGVEAEIRRRVVWEGKIVVERVTDLSSRNGGGSFAGFDLGGRAIVADETAQSTLGLPAAAPRVEVSDRARPDWPELSTVLGWATKRSLADPQWTGRARLSGTEPDAVVPVSLRPILAANRIIGILCEFGSQNGDERYENPGEPPALPMPQRVIGVRKDRVVVLSPAEIRYAEADRNTVWLNTDRGKVQAATRGLDNMARELRPFGFCRVHRRFVVNLRRVAELERGVKGELLLITDPRAPEFIPVSRSHTAEVRRLLGV
ncbi:DNA-binding protein [Amycolatopsis taiwanensis]|uniref:Fis family transcriptional regulator n=1 Tax=Amycolatopsis taiwanensis TaxID=342230 RepID=A0A9W6R0X8_9PSEU|nr:DNA-binding protein [Amycolatopsis taiwanensis]GLY65530.1 Fis family transcriptional regulator [Amycolatopsis taiwanensis]